MVKANLFAINFKPLELHKDTGLSVFFINNSLQIPSLLRKVDKDDIVSKVIVEKKFKGEKGDSIECTLRLDQDYICHCILIGTGKTNPTGADIKELVTGLCTTIEKSRMMHANLYLEAPLTDIDSCMDICTVLYMSSYSFNKYFNEKADKHHVHFKSATICTDLFKESEEQYSHIKHTLDGTTITRDLISEPSNVVYPQTFMEHCKKLEQIGVKVKVLDEVEMRKEGMNALLAVAQGSEHKPYTVLMEWNGLPNEKITEAPLTIVGKGVTFDSGGINIKSNPLNMKSDMSGAATVLGVMYSLAKNKAKVNVLGAVGLVENMPSGSAFKPDDVIVSMSKKTIEIDNTDAEGRLVLADVLWYVQTYYKPKAIVDLATLTGAIIVALGDYHAGLFTNDDELGKKLFAAGQQTRELLWQLPLADYYDKLNDSHIADIKNCARDGYGAGSITAAQFLKRFIKEGTPWAHLDIAGVAFKDKYSNTNSTKRATGFGVRLLIKFIKDNYAMS
jgi:leucyl aminopeptidase